MDTLSANLYRKPYGELLKDNTHRVLLLTLIRKKDLAIEQVIEDAQWNRYVVESISLIHVHWLINLNSLNSDSRSKSRSSFYNRHVHQEKIIVEQNRWKIHRCRNVPFDFFLNRNLFCRFVIQTWSSIDFQRTFTMIGVPLIFPDLFSSNPWKDFQSTETSLVDDLRIQSAVFASPFCSDLILTLIGQNTFISQRTTHFHLVSFHR